MKNLDSTAVYLVYIFSPYVDVYYFRMKTLTYGCRDTIKPSVVTVQCNDGKAEENCYISKIYE